MKIPSRRRHAAFTLIELMAVITIIVILAGLVVGGMGFVTERQAKEKAKVQLNLLAKSLEEYRLDNGSYPATADASTPPASNTNLIFKALYWDGVSDNSKKIYLDTLNPTNNKQGWISVPATGEKDSTIVDPWGKAYLYRTAFGLPNAQGKVTANSSTVNPEFDLWSMGKDGKTNVDPKHRDCRDDIRAN
jgi:general secretion pathway protein G